MSRITRWMRKVLTGEQWESHYQYPIFVVEDDVTCLVMANLSYDMWKAYMKLPTRRYELDYIHIHQDVAFVSRYYREEVSISVSRTCWVNRSPLKKAMVKDLQVAAFVTFRDDLPTPKTVTERLGRGGVPIPPRPR